MAQVTTRRIKVLNNQFYIVSEKFSIVGQPPYVKSFLEDYVSIKEIPGL
jgi:hypothetical protein